MSSKQEEKLNIYQKLAKMRKKVEVIKKTKSGFNYTYVPEDEVLAKITVQLENLQLLCLPEIVPGTFKVVPYTYTKTKVEKKTGQIYEEQNAEVIISAELVLTWINLENPEEQLKVPWTIVGMQPDASQALGSALTYCLRYYYLKFFNIATVESDPDNYRSKQRAAEAEEDKEITKEIIKTIDELSKSYVANSEDKDKARAEVETIVNKYEKSGNYNKIDQSVVAAKLLSDLQNTLDTGNKEE